MPNAYVTASPSALCRVGAWGQLGAIALAVASWSLGAVDGFLVACVGYLVVTAAGIAGIARAESAIAGPLVFPFLVPGFVPLYYVATRHARPRNS